MEVRRAAADYTRAERAFEERDATLPPGRARGGGAVDLRGHHALLPMLATDAGLRLQLGHWSRVARAPLRLVGGGFWLPECAYEPGPRARPGRAWRAGVLRRPDHGGGRRPAAAGGHRGRAGGGADRLGHDRTGLERQERLPGARGYRNYHGRTVHDLQPWNNAGQAYRHDEALALAREHARDFVDRVARGYAAGRPALLRPRHRAARPLVVRGAPPGSTPCSRRRRRGLDLVTVAEGVERVPAGAPAGGLHLGDRKDLSTWDGPGVADLAFAARRAELPPWPPRRPSGRRVPRSSGRRASCWRSRRATGRSWSRATWRRTTPRAGGPHGGPRGRAGGLTAFASAPDLALRGLAPTWASLR